MPSSRRETIRRLSEAVIDGNVELHVGADPERTREQLLAVRGIGPWTADYVVMRGLGHPDRFLDTDLGVRHALARLGVECRPVIGLGALALLRRAPPLGELEQPRRPAGVDNPHITNALHPRKKVTP